MALSLFQDAQTREIAAALAGIKREETDRSLTVSPPMTNNTSPVYSGLYSAAAASALGMLSPQLQVANRAAALMAARLPASFASMSSLSSLFPAHPGLFGAWHQPATTILPPNGGHHSPPDSPISPLNSSNKLTHHNHHHHHHNNNSAISNNNNNLNNNNNHSNNNNHLLSPTTTTTDMPPKKTRKISLKKDLISPPLDIPGSGNDAFTTGPISPPSSGSSPNSNQDAPTVHNSKDPSRDKCFTCKICNRSFGYKHVLQNHERTHTGEKPFECPECHKRFTRDHHLKTHMRLHTGEKPYHCSHCDRQFVQVANLRRHLRVHTGERPYTCEMCEARFSDSNQLKSHILIHNGEKPFECDRCHLKFRRRHHLMHHKCGIQSPPTPAMSPAMSDIGMSDQKSAISSFTSDESSDLNKSSLISHYDIPLDLSEEGIINSVATAAGGGNGSSTTDPDKSRSRKSSDIRRVLRLPKQILHVPINLPEQTEPEDLSMHSPRSPGSLQSLISSHQDDDLEDLDDAATLYLKHQQRQQRLKSISNHMTPIRSLHHDHHGKNDDGGGD